MGRLVYLLRDSNTKKCDLINALGRYEDLNLKPAQLRSMDRLYQKKCEEVVALKKEVEFYKKIYEEKLEQHGTLEKLLDEADREIKNMVKLPFHPSEHLKSIGRVKEVAYTENGTIVRAVRGFHSKEGYRGTEEIEINFTNTNLCEDCNHCIADCKSKEIVFGDGKGNDNVVICELHEAEQKILKRGEI
jgi:hypothetical protein